MSAPAGWDGRWANGAAEAMQRLWEAYAGRRFDARDREALRYLLERHDLREETRAAADDARRRMGEASGTGMAIATAIDAYRDRVASLAVAPHVVAGSATERHAIMVAIQAHVDAAVAAERARADKAEAERDAAQAREDRANWKRRKALGE